MIHQSASSTTSDTIATSRMVMMTITMILVVVLTQLREIDAFSTVSYAGQQQAPMLSTSTASARRRSITVRTLDPTKGQSQEMMTMIFGCFGLCVW